MPGVEAEEVHQCGVVVVVGDEEGGFFDRLPSYPANAWQTLEYQSFLSNSRKIQKPFVSLIREGNATKLILPKLHGRASVPHRG